MDPPFPMQPRGDGGTLIPENSDAANPHTASTPVPPPPVPIDSTSELDPLMTKVKPPPLVLVDSTSDHDPLINTVNPPTPVPVDSTSDHDPLVNRVNPPLPVPIDSTNDHDPLINRVDPPTPVPVDSASDHDPLMNKVKPPTSPRRRSRTRLGLKFFRVWWVAEIIASVLSVASLLSIVIILKKYEGRAMDQLNLPGWITLNGIIASISTLNRICLMLPVGAALSQEAWLWFSATRQMEKRTSRLRDLQISDAASRGAWGSLVLLFTSPRRYLAHFGAIITILSLAFGTFTQQLISYGMFPVPGHETSLLPGNIPRAETWQEFEGALAEGAMSIPLTMKAAIYNGIMSEGVAPVVATCLTGNCTWPITPSMAVCGECSHSTHTTSCNSTTCVYTVPSGSTMVFPNTTAGEGLGFQVTASEGATYNYSKHDKLYIANFDVFGAPYGSFSEGDYLSVLTSQECAIWLCIQTFDVDMSSGQQTQRIVDTFSTIDSTIPGGFMGNTNFTFLNLPNDIHPTPDTVYTVNIDASIALHQFLAPMFNGTVFLKDNNQSPSSDSIQAVWNGTSDLNAWVQNLAVSMTNVVRVASPNSRSVYDGTAYQLGVRIRWVWISLPAAIVGASLAFLVIVIVETARSPIEAWKGSPLAILMFGVDQETESDFDTHAIIDGYKTLEDTVGKTVATLRRQPGGRWTFKTTGA